MTCPSDVWVKIAVPEIVDGAASATHDQSTGSEEGSGGDDRRGGRVTEWSSQESAKQARQEEIGRSCWFVETS